MRKPALIVLAIFAVVAVVTLIVSNPRKDNAFLEDKKASNVGGNYQGWLQHLGGYTEFGADLDKPNTLKPDLDGPYIPVDDTFNQPSDLVANLKTKEQKEKRKLVAIENIIKKHNQIPYAIDIVITRRPIRGAPGSPGPVGPRGLIGEPGDKGERGKRGERGNPGPQGAVGDIGRAGRSGPPGPRGYQGASGIQGPVGDVGPIGDRGYTGATGARGSPGTPGIPGLSGTIGPPGKVGPRGLAGKAGADGKNGVPIRPAFNGKVAVYWGRQVDTSREGSYVEIATRGVPGVIATDHFQDVTAASWSALARSYGCILIPELENGPLVLDATAKSALRTAVSNGVILLVMGGQQGSAFINSVFDTHLEYKFDSCNAAKQPAAAATRFDLGPATLHYMNAVFGVKTVSLGTDWRLQSMYACDDVTTVFRIRYGSGNIMYLGFDWYASNSDAQWVSVLNNALRYSG